MNGERHAPAERFCFAVLLPLWMVVASGDYLLHRRSRIETTSGVVEARLHCAGIALMLPPVLAGILCEVDAGVLALMAASLIVHRFMVAWDVRYAKGRRRIVPLEQGVHELLEALPLSIISLVGVAHRRQALAMVGCGEEYPRWRVRLKRKPIALRLIALYGAAFAAMVVLPYAEELRRCHRAERDRRLG